MNGATLRSAIYLAIFAVVTLFLTFVLAVTITNGSVGSTVSYRAQISDTTGLLSGDDVRIAGVRVGQVGSIRLTRNCPRSATDPTTVPACSMVTFGLDKSIPLHVSARILVHYRNLVGQRYLDIVESPGTDAVVAKNGLVYLDHTAPALDLTTLFDGFRPLFAALDPEDVNRVAYEVVASLQGEGGTIDSLLANTASLSTAIASQDAAIGSLISNLTGVLATVDQRDGELTTLIDQLQRLVTGLAGDRDAIAASLSNVNALAVSTTTLLASIRPELPTDLSQLSGLTNTLATTSVSVNGTTQNQLDEFLNRFPSKLTIITRTATYGSFFNFYLCHADIALGQVAGQALNASLQSTNSTICGTGGS